MKASPVVEISANPGATHYLKDVWRGRYLIWTFAWRDVLLRYKQTFVGLLWVLLRPLITLAVFVLVFGTFLKVPPGDIPYPLLVLSGLIPWQFFTAVLAGVSESLFVYSAILGKVYFPRLAVPISALLVNALDTVVTLLLLVPFLAYYGVAPSFGWLAIPLAFAAAIPACFGIGLWLGAVSAKYRDFRNLVPFLVVVLLYGSPVAFSSDVIPPGWRDLYWMNPVVPVIEGFRWLLFGKGATPPAMGAVFSIIISALLLVYGYRRFRETERSLVDIL